MKKNEAQSYSNSNQPENNFIMFQYIKSNPNAFTKINFSRNALLKSKNKTSMNFYSGKNYNISKNNSKDVSNKNEESFKIENNSISNKKTVFVNFVQCKLNFLRRISAKDLKHNINLSKTLDMKKNSNIINLLNKTQIKNRKTDISKYKFLLGQKNNYKQLYQKDDFSFLSHYYKKINPYLIKSSKRFNIDFDKFKILFFRQKEKSKLSYKDVKENLSIFSYKNFKNNKKNNIFRKSNYTTIKIKKSNTPNNLKKTNGLLNNFKDTNLNKVNKEGKNHNESIEQEKIIINNNLNEYLKDVSSSDSNKSKSEAKNENLKNHKFIIKKLKPLKNKLSLKETNKIYKYMQRMKKTYDLNMVINNKKFIPNKRINLEDINKDIIILNPVSRKKNNIRNKVI